MKRICLYMSGILAVILAFASCEQNAGSVPVAPIPGETPKEIIGIEITDLPARTLYIITEQPDFSGLKVNGIYDDGTVTPLATGDYVIDKSELDGTEGKKRIYVRAGGFTESFEIQFVSWNIKDVVFTLVTYPAAIQKFGSEFDKSGMAIKARFSDSMEIDIDPDICEASGYDKRSRGSRRIAFKLNGVVLGEMDVTVRITGNAVVTIYRSSGYRPGESLKYRPVWIKGETFSLAKLGLTAIVSANGQRAVFTPGNGIEEGDVTGYKPAEAGEQELTLTLDDAQAPVPIYIADAEPNVYFDYGYMRQESEPAGRGPGAGKYYVKQGDSIVIAPVRFLIGYNNDHSNDARTSYEWSQNVTVNGETAVFTGATTGIYTVTVNVTGRNYITGEHIIRAASTEVECYTGTLPAEEWGDPVSNPESSPGSRCIRNFAPGQMTESDTATGYGWSLGAALGYEVWSVSGQTIVIRGNGFGTWNEPGIVWVQEDKNANGVPDEMWYEIKGGDDDSNYSSQITRRYAVKYFNNPEIDGKKYGQVLRRIYWVDSKGRAGILPGGWPGNATANAEFGATPKGWGVSADSNWVIYTGTILRDTGIGDGGGVPGAAAYVDCFYGNSPGITVDKSKAIDAAGNPVPLGDIRFVKVQTGVFSYDSNGGFGEISTEIHSASGLGRQTTFPLPEDS